MNRMTKNKSKWINVKILSKEENPTEKKVKELEERLKKLENARN